MKIDMDLRIADEAWRTVSEDLEAFSLAALNAAADEAGRQGVVDVLLSGDDEIQALNQAWRGQDTPTDVLSFPAHPSDAPFLGDIAVAHGVVSRDAETAGKTVSAHLAHMLVHGCLHLFGFDHQSEPEASEMEALERSALARLGLPDPY